MKTNTSQFVRNCHNRKQNKITTSYINTATYREKSMIAHGACDEGLKIN